MALTENERTRGTNPRPTGRRPTLEEIQYGKKDDKNECSETKEEPIPMINLEKINEYLEENYNYDDTDSEEIKRKIKDTAKEINDVWVINNNFEPGELDTINKHCILMELNRLYTRISDLKEEYESLNKGAETQEMIKRLVKSEVNELADKFLRESFGSLIKYDKNNFSEDKEEINNEIEEQKQGKHSPRPNHYQIQLPDGYKLNSILLIQSLLTPEEFRGFLKGNILKYVFREGKKNGLEDIKKLNTYNKWIINVMNNEPLEGIE